MISAVKGKATKAVKQCELGQSASKIVTSSSGGKKFGADTNYASYANTMMTRTTSQKCGFQVNHNNLDLEERKGDL